MNDAVRRASGWRRHTIGLLALGLLLAGVVFWIGFERSASVDSARAFCIRVGALLSALWLALPQLAAIFVKYPPWLIVTSLLLLGLVIVQPKALGYAIPVVGVLLALHFFGWFTRRN